MKVKKVNIVKLFDKRLLKKFPLLSFKLNPTDDIFENPYLDCDCYVSYTSNGTVLGVCIIKDFHIYLFEINKFLRGKGYGRRFFERIVKIISTPEQKVTLNYLDDNALKFWTSVGCIETDRQNQSLEYTID